DHASPDLARIRHDARVLLHRPWNVIRFRDACIAHDLAALLPEAPHDAPRAPHFTVDGDPDLLRVHPGAHIAPGVVFDTRAGAVIVGEAEIQPNSVIVGPCAIADHCLIAARALIKANTALGPHSKVGGEVGGTI